MRQQSLLLFPPPPWVTVTPHSAFSQPSSSPTLISGCTPSVGTGLLEQASPAVALTSAWPQGAL